MGGLSKPGESIVEVTEERSETVAPQSKFIAPQKSLFEQLEAQKAEAEAAFKEKHGPLHKPPRALDDEDVLFLDQQHEQAQQQVELDSVLEEADKAAFQQAMASAARAPKGAAKPFVVLPKHLPERKGGQDGSASTDALAKPSGINARPLARVAIRPRVELTSVASSSLKAAPASAESGPSSTSATEDAHAPLAKRARISEGVEGALSASSPAATDSSVVTAIASVPAPSGTISLAQAPVPAATAHPIASHAPPRSLVEYSDGSDDSD